MEENSNSSWITHYHQHLNRYIPPPHHHHHTETDSFSDGSDEDSNKTKTKTKTKTNTNTNQLISVDSFLPDDLLERILSYLPTASLFRAGSVSKRWHDIVTSERFLWNPPQDITQKPWYFMFTGSDHDSSSGYAYDPTFRKWHCIDLPEFITSQWFVSSSCGLVCFMDNERSPHQLHICNPITRSTRRVVMEPTDVMPEYIALAIHRVSRRRYNVTVIKSKQVPEHFYQWEISIHVYDSETGKWAVCRTETLTGWRAGDASVICGDGVLFFLMYYVGGGGVVLDNNHNHNNNNNNINTRHGLIRYDFSNHRQSSSSSDGGGGLMRNFIPAPCSLTCGRLMNMREKLVMVGGIGKPERLDVIKGIGVWFLDGSEWREVGRMPHRFFQGFGELDDVFASSGTDDLIYIQSYGKPLLLVFDMSSRLWKWSVKCPVTKRFSLQLFTGFCFEPRLEINP